MIIAEQKTIDEILGYVRDYKNIVVASCGTCVTVCMAGGEKEAAETAGMIKVFTQEQGLAINVAMVSFLRQCDMEFLEEGERELAHADLILSMACGAGVQFMAEKFPDKMVAPALNTKFIGVNRDIGYWTEMCQGCGNCILENTGGICPVARCSKSHFNGPCGGSSSGKCEINDEIDCAWQLIYDRLKRIGQLDRLLEINEVRDWSTARDGGPRTLRREDVIL